MTGTVQVRVAFPNPNRLLNNGNSGTVLVPKKYTNALVVPEVASFEQQGKINVFRVVNDTVISTMLDVTDRVNNMLIVNNGVKEGDIIVVSGIGSLRNKSAIQRSEEHTSELQSRPHLVCR